MSFLDIFLLLVGMILFAIGLILLVVHRPPDTRQWWMWVLLILGIILFLLGLAIFIFGWNRDTLAHGDDPLTTTTTRHVEVEHRLE